MANATGDAGEQQPVRDYLSLSQLLTAERLGSYLHWSGGDLQAAFALYEWNMSASAAVMHTTGMVEVVVRNAMDRALQDRREPAVGRRGSTAHRWTNADETTSAKPASAPPGSAVNPRSTAKSSPS